MANNGSTNFPSTVLETFTPDAITGSGTTTNAHYLINYTLNAGTKFWIVEAQQSTSFPRCHASSFDATTMPMDAVAIDTSTTGSNTSFRRAYIYDSSVSNGASWQSVQDSLIFQFSLEDNSGSTVNSSVMLNSGEKIAQFRTTTILKAIVDAQSYVTFYANSKTIPGCIKVLSSSGSAYCNWKPSVHGNQQIKVKAQPTDGRATSFSPVISIGVRTRTNTR